MSWSRVLPPLWLALDLSLSFTKVVPSFLILIAQTFLPSQSFRSLPILKKESVRLERKIHSHLSQRSLSVMTSFKFLYQPLKKYQKVLR